MKNRSEASQSEERSQLVSPISEEEFDTGSQFSQNKEVNLRCL